MPPQTLLLNARVFTGRNDQLDYQSSCILVKDDLIEHVGSIEDSAIQEARKVGVHEHDVGGRILTPGFIDGHMHILLFASSLQAINLENCHNLDDIHKTIREGAAARPNEDRLFVQGWMHL